MEMELNINATSIYRILTEHLGFRKVCARFVPHKLTDAEKALRIQHSKDIIKEAKNDPNFLFNIVTGDETWCFQYDPETKRQSAEWKAPSEPNPKKITHGEVKSEDNVDLFLRFEGNYSS
jgi:histone-lysine N-methyltransferase SETMAR